MAYSRLSTTHGHITDCKLDSVVYAGVLLVLNLIWGHSLHLSQNALQLENGWPGMKRCEIWTLRR